jgi:hypothetical protein
VPLKPGAQTIEPVVMEKDAWFNDPAVRVKSYPVVVGAVQSVKVHPLTL